MWLHRFIPSIPAKSQPIMSLWICNTNGSRMQQIGYQDLKGPESAGAKPCSLRWLPGGKRLSFLCQKTLWTVPVEN